MVSIPVEMPKQHKVTLNVFFPKKSKSVQNKNDPYQQSIASYCPTEALLLLH